MSQITHSPQYGSTCLAARWSSVYLRVALVCLEATHWS